METASDLIIATDRNYIDVTTADPLLIRAYDLSVRIHNLRDSQLRRHEAQQ